MVKWLILAALVCITGCHSKNPAQERANLRQLAVQYGQYASFHQGMGPPGPGEFKEFIKENRPIKDEDVDKMFISNRDHEPFVVYYNLVLTAPDEKGGPAIAHEKTGVDGKRLVALPTTRVEEVDDARLAELIPKTP